MDSNGANGDELIERDFWYILDWRLFRVFKIYKFGILVIGFRVELCEYSSMDLRVWVTMFLSSSDESLPSLQGVVIVSRSPPLRRNGLRISRSSHFFVLALSALKVDIIVLDEYGVKRPRTRRTTGIVN